MFASFRVGNLLQNDALLDIVSLHTAAQGVHQVSVRISIYALIYFVVSTRRFSPISCALKTARELARRRCIFLMHFLSSPEVKHTEKILPNLTPLPFCSFFYIMWSVSMATNRGILSLQTFAARSFGQKMRSKTFEANAFKNVCSRKFRPKIAAF